jgi:hypothetical protein
VSEFDPQIVQALDRLVPPVRDGGDWNRVTRDARLEHAARLDRRWRKPAHLRRTLAVALAATAVFAALPAFAVVRGWWFFDHGQLTPAGAVMTVTSGGTDESRWDLVAFVSEEHGLCVGITDSTTRGRGGLGCGMPVRGAPQASAEASEQHWVGYGQTSVSETSSAALVFGPVASEVREVTVEVADGTSYSTATIAAPADLNLPLRFYVAEIPRSERGRALVASDADGRTLERLEIPARG